MINGTDDENAQWDVLIKNGLIFDGWGGLPRTGDLAISKGKIVADGVGLEACLASEVIDAEGSWVIPGMLDIHTHVDLEVELDHGLSECIRHGTTSVVVGNCSLGLAFGAQSGEGYSAIVDCFARVENIPKSILDKTVEQITWTNPQEYIQHLDELSLGANIIPQIPHSMLRLEVMGYDAALSREPTESEMREMVSLLGKSFDAGYTGFSTDGLAFHYMSIDPNKKKEIPSQWASDWEIRTLTQVVRNRNRVWQMTPYSASALKTLWSFLYTSSRLWGKSLKTSALAAVDSVGSPNMGEKMIKVSRFLNSKLVGGRFHFQALSTTFYMWADGITTPMFEESPAIRELVEKELDDIEGRKALLLDEAYRRQFRKDWWAGRKGPSLARVKKILGIPTTSVVRDLTKFTVDRAPVRQWAGQTLHDIRARYVEFNNGNLNSALCEEEKEIFQRLSKKAANDEADFFMDLLLEFDRDLRWYTATGNVDHSKIPELLTSDFTLPGFNDSGAHLTNMAFYDGNLETLRLAQRESISTVARQVSRLTRIPAEFWGVDAGRLDVGCRADVVLIDPEALRRHDSVETRKLIYREELQHEAMVNRPKGVVTHVFVNGIAAWRHGRKTEALGTQKLGRPLLYSASR